jgi:hypothetical protein
MFEKCTVTSRVSMSKVHLHAARPLLPATIQSNREDRRWTRSRLTLERAALEFDHVRERTRHASRHSTRRDKRYSPPPCGPRTRKCVEACACVRTRHRPPAVPAGEPARETSSQSASRAKRADQKEMRSVEGRERREGQDRAGSSHWRRGATPSVASGPRRTTMSGRKARSRSEEHDAIDYLRRVGFFLCRSTRGALSTHDGSETMMHVDPLMYGNEEPRQGGELEDVIYLYQPIFLNFFFSNFESPTYFAR